MLRILRNGRIQGVGDFPGDGGGFDPGSFDPGSVDLGSLPGFDLGGGLSDPTLSDPLPGLGDNAGFAGLPDFAGFPGTFDTLPGSTSPLPGLGDNAGFSGGTEVLGPPGSLAPDGTSWQDIISGAGQVVDTGTGLLGKFGFGLDLSQILGGNSPIVRTPGTSTTGGTGAAAGGSHPGTTVKAGVGGSASGGMGLALLAVAALFLFGGGKK